MNPVRPDKEPRRGRILLACFLALALLPVHSLAAAPPPSVIEGVDALKERIRRARGIDGVLCFSDRGLLKEVFLPLAEEGVIRTLELVVPVEYPLEERDLKAWQGYVSSVQAGADNAFRLREGAIEGALGTLSITVHPYGTWKGARPSAAPVMDLRFIPGIYSDEARTPMVELAPRLLLRVRDRGVDFSRLTLWTGGRGDVPLFFGYLYRLVPRVLRDPAAFGKGLPPKWQELSRAEVLNFHSLYEEAETHYKRFLKQEPGEPSVLYKLALMNFDDDRVNRGLRRLVEAYRSDPYYIRAYPEAAFRLFQDRELGAAERVLRAGILLAPGLPELKVGLGRVILAQALKMLPADAAAAAKRFGEVEPLGLPAEAYGQLREEWEKARSSPPVPGLPPGGSRKGKGGGMHGH